MHSYSTLDVSTTAQSSKSPKHIVLLVAEANFALAASLREVLLDASCLYWLPGSMLALTKISSQDFPGQILQDQLQEFPYPEKVTTSCYYLATESSLW
jgi:hypothetical protein